MARPLLFASVSQLPVILAAIGLLVGGGFLLHRSEAQARDTIRKHHLYDLEQALYSAYSRHGTYPPYDQPTWCGVLQDPSSDAVRAEVETALRAQNTKYANPQKPFPTDPLPNNQGYFYWKRSPAVFELYSILEAAPTGDRSTDRCPGAGAQLFDYGINSRLRTTANL